MNIGDIAEMAGVSRAAVSRYLNNGYISEEKSERIRKVIEETGYKPSVMAQTLRTKKSKLIGVVLPRIDSDSISGTVAGIGSSLNAAGYEMLLATTDNSPEKELEYLRVFSNNRVDGVILIATVLTREHRKLIKEMKIPVVVVGQCLSGCLSVFHDDEHAGRELGQCMLENGRKKVGYIGVLKDDVAVGQKRCEGFLQAMAEAGIAFPQERMVIAEFSETSGQEKMRQLLAVCPDLDGVVCATDRIALGAIRELKAQGRRIPEDVAVAGFGDNKIAGVMTPGLTTIHFYYRECGATAASRMIEQLEAGEHATKEIKLGFELIRRESL